MTENLIFFANCKVFFDSEETFDVHLKTWIFCRVVGLLTIAKMTFAAEMADRHGLVAPASDFFLAKCKGEWKESSHYRVTSPVW